MRLTQSLLLLLSCSLVISTQAQVQGWTVYSVGYNTKGGLALENPSASPIPAANGGGLTLQWDYVSADGNHACGIDKASNKLYCWGNTKFSNQPVPPADSDNGAIPFVIGASPRSYIRVSVGQSRVCAIEKDTQNLYCFGDSGFVGAPSNEPVLIGLVENKYIEVAVGGSHTCAITVDSDMVCFGDGSEGQLGTGARTSSLAPVNVTGGYKFTSVVAGDVHTCGLQNDEQGRLLCWGSNAKGQLGETDIPIRTLAPKRVLTFVSSVYAQGYTTCAIERKFNNLECWGALLNVNEPTLWGGGSTKNFTTAAIGSTHICAVELNTKDAYCAYTNYYGELGNGKAPNASVTPVLAGSDAYTSIVAGDGFTLGLLDSGDLNGWGRNDVGQLGTGDSAEYNTPVQVKLGLKKWIYATTGPDGAISCLIDTNKNLYCAGSYLKDDQGNPLINFGPTLIGSLADTYRHVAVGSGSVCAVRTNDLIVCFGDNKFGKLGLGSDAAHINEPTLLPGKWRYAAAGPSTTCFIKGVGSNQNSTLWCSGRVPTKGKTNIPVLMGTLDEKWIDASVGNNHICATKLYENRVYCLGDNEKFQLGVPDIASSKIFVLAGDGKPISKMQCSANHCCSINKRTSSASCWGSPGAALSPKAGQKASAKPVVVGGSSSVWGNVVVGGDSTCVIDALTLKPRCFGSNSYIQSKEFRAKSWRQLAISGLTAIGLQAKNSDYPDDF